MAPPLSQWGEEGFSSCSTCPRHRAVAITPPECPAASARCDGPCCLRLSTVRLGLRGLSISGPPVRSLPLRPGDSLTILSMASSVGFRVLVSLHPATQVTGLWLLPRRDWLPLNTSASLDARLITSSNLVGCSTGRSAGLGALEDLVHVDRGAPKQISDVRPIGHEATRLRRTRLDRVHCGQPVLVPPGRRSAFAGRRTWLATGQADAPARCSSSISVKPRSKSAAPALRSTSKPHPERIGPRLLRLSYRHARCSGRPDSRGRRPVRLPGRPPSELEPLAASSSVRSVNPGDIAARPRQAGDEPARDRIADASPSRWGSSWSPAWPRGRDRAARGHDDVDLEPRPVRRRERGSRSELALRRSRYSMTRFWPST